jgi:hypothetical protein
MNTILKSSYHKTSIQSVLTVRNEVTSFLQLSLTKFESTKAGAGMHNSYHSLCLKSLLPTRNIHWNYGN